MPGTPALESERSKRSSACEATRGGNELEASALLTRQDGFANSGARPLQQHIVDDLNNRPRKRLRFNALADPYHRR